MVDWGAWVIVAALAGAGNTVFIYRPSTRFDLPACVRQAKDINQRWHHAGIAGFATCNLAGHPPILIPLHFFAASRQSAAGEHLLPGGSRAKAVSRQSRTIPLTTGAVGRSLITFRSRPRRRVQRQEAGH
jgi:hypothetical protein